MTDRIATRVWLSAVAALVAVFGVLAERDPAPARPVTLAQARPVVVHRRIVRRTVVTRVITAPAAAVTTSAPVVTTSAPAPAPVAPAPAPAAPVTTHTS